MPTLLSVKHGWHVVTTCGRRTGGNQHISLQETHLLDQRQLCLDASHFKAHDKSKKVLLGSTWVLFKIVGAPNHPTLDRIFVSKSMGLGSPPILTTRKPNSSPTPQRSNCDRPASRSSLARPTDVASELVGSPQFFVLQPMLDSPVVSLVPARSSTFQHVEVAI